MRHPEFPILSFLSIPILLCSLPSHARAGSVSILAMMAWLVVISFIRGVNAIVWAGNVDVRLQVWCDITTKITIGFTYAIPASALCIIHHLENVASTRNVSRTKADKRRRQFLEAIMCFGLPLIGMALHYVVQGHRLDIIEDFGCYPPVYFSVAALFILWIPPFVMSLCSFVYAAMALHHFMRHRIEFAVHLRNSQSAISPGRYLRLMAMAVVEMVWDTGVNAYIIWFNVTFGGFRPWISWQNVHSNFSRVAVFPAFVIPPIFMTQLTWQWCIVPISCILFTFFFAFGEEARADYMIAIRWMRRMVLRRDGDGSVAHGPSSILPIHRHIPPRDICIAVSSFTEVSEHSRQPWDDLSLKMPDGFANTLPVTLSYPEGLEKPRTAYMASGDPGHLTLDRISDNSSDISESELTLNGATTQAISLQPSAVFTPQIPTPTVTHAERNKLSLREDYETARPGSPSPTSHIPSPDITRSLSWRQSTSGITISSAYFPDDDTAMRSHVEAHLSENPSNICVPSHAEAAYLHSLGNTDRVSKEVIP